MPNPYEIALNNIPGVGDVLAKQLVSYCGSAEAVFKTPKGKLMKIPGIGEKTASLLVEAQQNKALLSEADAELNKLQKVGGKVLFYTHPDYPNRLKRCADAPILLYTKGPVQLNAGRVVSIVGTRSATAYGKGFIEQLLDGLRVFDDLLLVSGLAYGIDIHAHRESLKCGIPTVGVMASGLDWIYPAVHKGTAEQMIEQGGGLVTENKLGTKPDAPLFPARNRIIAGMSDIVVVVEAASAGGALITAEIANSYSVEVMALPGNYNSKYSEGCNNLIKDHKAHPITKVSDLIELMGWEPGKQAKKKGLMALPLDDLSSEEKNIIQTLQNGPLHIDQLSYKTQLPVNQLASLLLSLEFAGLVKLHPGQRYSLVGFE